jgi:hypothetical protein
MYCDPLILMMLLGIAGWGLLVFIRARYACPYCGTRIEDGHARMPVEAKVKLRRRSGTERTPQWLAITFVSPRRHASHRSWRLIEVYAP